MNKNKELLPYYEMAKSTISYNPTTGTFIWKESRTNKIKIGSDVGFSNKNTSYRFVSIGINNKKATLALHRLAWFLVHGTLPCLINHKNHIPYDNRIQNLEDVTKLHNNWDQVINKKNTSGYKGVHWHKNDKKWQAKISHKGKRIYIGNFNCPKEASEAYEAKAKELRGHRYRNFINGGL